MNDEITSYYGCLMGIFIGFFIGVIAAWLQFVVFA